MRCEIWRRYGGAFTLGPVQVHGIDPERPKKLIPVCKDCVAECVEKVPGVQFKPLERKP